MTWMPLPSGSRSIGFYVGGRRVATISPAGGGAGHGWSVDLPWSERGECESLDEAKRRAESAVRRAAIMMMEST